MKAITFWKKLPIWQKILFFIVVFYSFYIILSSFIFPYAVKKVVTTKLSKFLKRNVKISKIYFNPFTLSFKIKNFKVKKKTRKEIFCSFKDLEVNFEFISIFKLAPVISHLKLEAPFFYIEREKDGKFNFSDLFETDKRDKATNRKSFLFSINNIEIRYGRILFLDRIKKEKHEIKDLYITLPFISNFPYFVKIFHKPYLKANLDGAEFVFKGKLKPFVPTKESYLNIEFDNLDLTKFISYLPKSFPFIPKSGNLSTKFKLSFKETQKSPYLSLSGVFVFKKFSISKGKEPFFYLNKLLIKLLPSDIFNKKFIFKEISIYNPKFFVLRKKENYKKGNSNFLKILFDRKDFELFKKRLISNFYSKLSKLPKIEIYKFKLKNGIINLKDKLKRSYQINFTLKNVSTYKRKDTILQLEISNKEESYRVFGNLTLKPLNLKLNLFSKVNIHNYSSYYKDFFVGNIKKGELKFRSKLIVSSSKDLDSFYTSLIDTSIEVKGVSVYQRERILSLGKMLVNIKEFSLDELKLRISKILISNSKIKLTRDKKGVFNFHRLFYISSQKQEKSKKNFSISNFKVFIDEVLVSPINITFLDYFPQKNVKLYILDFMFKAHNIDLFGNRSFEFMLKGRINKSSQLKVNGFCSLERRKIDAKVSLKRFPIETINGYIEDFLNIKVLTGNISYEGKILYNKGVSLNGLFKLNRVKIINTLDNKEMVNVSFIKVYGFRFSYLSYIKLKIQKLLVDNFYIYLERYKNLSCNFLKIVKSYSTNMTKDDNLNKDKNINIDIKLIKINNGSIKFIDKSVSPYFWINLSNISFILKDLLSLSNRFADISGSAVINKSGFLNIRGKLNPFFNSIDIKLKVENVEMNQLTPYSVEYIGYPIIGGKLNLNLDFLLKGDYINVRNKIFLDQFVLGDKIEGKGNINLPVKFAVALLTDKKGQIKLDIPIKGNIKDPKFSVASAVFRIIKNLIVKAVTSPISLLAAMFGGGEDLQFIIFDLGKANFSSPQEIDKLKVLGKALRDRPQIKVELEGSFDPIKDKEALEKIKFDLLLKMAKYKDLSKNIKKSIKLEDVTIGPDEYEKYLRKAWREAPIKKEKNFLGFIKKQPVEVMERMLREYCKVTNSELRELAIKRAKKVESYLINRENISPKRIFIVEPGTKKNLKSKVLNCVIVNIKN